MTLVEINNEKSSFNSAAIHTDIRSLNGLCFPIIRRISRSSKIHHVEHCVSSQDTVKLLLTVSTMQRHTRIRTHKTICTNFMVSLSLDQSFYPRGEYENVVVFILPLFRQADKQGTQTFTYLCTQHTHTHIYTLYTVRISAQ